MGSSAKDYCLSRFGQELVHEINTFGVFKIFEPGHIIIQQGKYPKYLPIVLNGCVNVYSSEDSQRFLLYYIVPQHPRILSIIYPHNNKPVEFSVICEERTEIVLIPIYKAREWIIKYSSFTNLILMDFQEHYNELLYHSRQVMSYKLEERLVAYLKTKSRHSSANELTLTHQRIADDLGTTREVVSRILKKLMLKNVILLSDRKIIVL